MTNLHQADILDLFSFSGCISARAYNIMVFGNGKVMVSDFIADSTNTTILFRYMSLLGPTNRI